MFHEQHVSHKWHVFVFFFHVLPRAPYGMSGVGSFPVHSGGSLSIFPAL